MPWSQVWSGALQGDMAGGRRGSGMRREWREFSLGMRRESSPEPDYKPSTQGQD